MARRNVEKEHIRKIQHSKGSYYITLPVQLVRKFRWKERQKIVVHEYGKQKLLIADWKK